jgi:hypothetical protein
MIEEAKAFIEGWLRAEVEARNASVKTDAAEANRTVAAMHAACLPEFGEPFGVTPRVFPKPPSFYAQHGHLQFAQTTRKLFKISAYRHAHYDTVFAAYLSQWTNDAVVADESYFDCLLLGRVDGSLRIARHYWVSHTEGDETVLAWRGGAGDQALSLEALGKPFAIERYRQPRGCAFSLQHYDSDA